MLERVYALNRQLAASKPGAWLLARVAPTVDRWIVSASKGRMSGTSFVTGLPLIMLTTTGAKSGLPRVTPLLGLQQGENFIVIASNFGQAHYPAWYYNLTAHPDVQISLRGRTGRYLAREVMGAERDAAWAYAVRIYPGYAAYASRVRGRHIPVFILEPAVSEA